MTARPWIVTIHRHGEPASTIAVFTRLEARALQRDVKRRPEFYNGTAEVHRLGLSRWGRFEAWLARKFGDLPPTVGWEQDAKGWHK